MGTRCSPNRKGRIYGAVPPDKAHTMRRYSPEQKEQAVRMVFVAATNVHVVEPAMRNLRDSAMLQTPDLTGRRLEALHNRLMPITCH